MTTTAPHTRTCVRCGAAIAPSRYGGLLSTPKGAFCSLTCVDEGPWGCPVAWLAPTWCCSTPSRLTCEGARRCVFDPDTLTQRLAGWCFCGCHVTERDVNLGRMTTLPLALSAGVSSADMEGAKIILWRADGHVARRGELPVRVSWSVRLPTHQAMAQAIVRAGWAGLSLAYVVGLPMATAALVEVRGRTPR